VSVIDGLETRRSAEVHERARRFLPKGVTGDGRWSSPYPIVFARGDGKYLTDVDGNTYLDYHGGFGTAILGYAHPEVDEAVIHATREAGAFVGVPHVYEAALAERLCSLIPCAERVALCGGGGSDPAYHSVRLARAATGRRRILKIEGGYQGWHSDLGVSTRPLLDDPAYAGLPEGVPNSAGILPEVADAVLIATVNDGAALEQVFARHGEELAAMIVEPVVYSCGCVQVDREYLELARTLCTRHGTVLIFDEVMTGFRNGVGGAGGRAGVVPDLGVFGKAVANGYILSFLAGKAELMTSLAPEGPVFYSGTFNGHPLSVAAAQATLDVIEREGVPEQLWSLGDRIADGINATVTRLGLNAVCQAYGSVWNLYFNTTSVRHYRDLAQSSGAETERLNERYHAFLRSHRIYLHKRHVNRGFVSAMHTAEDADRTVAVVSDFLNSHQKDLAR
jgi:glutamate-1-semialdehyde 2,1-aminomutase